MIELRTLKIVTDGDTTGYTRSLAAKDAAEAKTIASTKTVNATLDQTDRKLGETGSKFERLARSIDPAYAAQQKFEAGERSLNRALDGGKVSVERHTQLMDLLRQRYTTLGPAVNDNTKAMATATAGTGQMRFALQNLSFQLNDIGTSLASGGSPFRVLAQQSGQVIQIFQQYGFSAVMGAAGTAIRGMITPLSAAAAGVGVLAVGLGVLVARAADANQSIRAFDVTLRGMGTSGLATAIDLEATAKRLRDVGLSATEARAQILSVARAGLNPAAADQIIRTGTDFGAVMGGNGVEMLTRALAGGLDDTIKLGLALKAFGVEEAAAYREAARLGDGINALDRAFGRITEKIKGAERDALSPAGRAMRDLSVAWNSMLDSLSASAPVILLVEKLTALANVIERLAKGDFKGFASNLTLGIPQSLANALPGGALVSGLADAGRVVLSNVAPQPAATAAFQDFDMNALVNAVIRAESRGDPNARSPKGAMGLMQLMPGTAAQYGVSNPFNGDQNVAGGTAFLSDLLAKYNGDVDLALMAYNWGPGNVDKYLAGVKTTVPKETTAYVAQVKANLGANAGGAGASASTGDNRAGLDAANQIVEAQKRQAAATAGVGLENEKLKAQLEAGNMAQRGQIEGSEVATKAAELYAIAVTRLTNEIVNETAATKLEVTGAQSIAEAYQNNARQGKIQEAIVRGQTQAHRLFGETSTEAAREYAAARALETIALEKHNEVLRNAQDMLTQKDTQAVLQLELNLTGQTTEEIQRQVTMLQAKQQIEREFPFLSEQEKNNRIAMVQATADLNFRLAETRRAQQEIDNLFRSVGDTIASSIGSVLEGIFDPSKAKKWGESLKSIFSSIASQIAQSLVIRPLTGSLLSMLGASGSVVQGFGTLGGSGSGGSSSSGGLSLGNLMQGGGFLKDIFGGSSSSGGGLFGGGGSGGMFSGVSDFFSGGLGGIFAHTPTAVDFAAGVGPVLNAPGSLFGATTLGGGLGGIGGGMGAGMFVNSLMGGNTMFGGIGSGIGSIAGTLIGGPIGGMIGGALGGMIGGMFGNSKPRNQSAGGNIDFSTGQVFGTFSGGNAQIDQATAQIIQQLGGFTQNLLRLSGGKLSGEVLLQNGVNTGFTADSSLPGYEGRFNLGKDPAEVVRVVSLALAKSLTDVSGTMRHVIHQISDPAKLEAALQFAAVYDNIDEAFRGAFANIPGQEQIGPFAQALTQIRTLFQDLAEKAGELHLSLDPVVAGLEEATTRLRDDFVRTLDQTFNEASGRGFLNQIQALYEGYRAATKELDALDMGRPDLYSQLGLIFDAQIGGILGGLDVNQLTEVINAFGNLSDTALPGLAEAARLAAGAVVGVEEAASRLRADFVKTIDQAFNEATGRGFLNQIQALYEGYQAAVLELDALDMGQTDLYSRLGLTFDAQVGSVLGGLDVSQLTEVINAFSNLSDTALPGLAEAARSAAEAAEAVAVSMQSLIDLRTELTSGALSGLTPGAQATAANDNFNSLMALVTAGDTSQIGALATAGQAAIQYSLEAYGNSPQTAALRVEILAALDQLLAGSFAVGSPSTPPGMILVGERGPELMMQAGGARIWSNHETERMLVSMPSFPQARSFADGTGPWSDPVIKSLLVDILAELRGNTRVTQGGLVETIRALRAQLDEMKKPAVIEPQRSRFG